ncbi:hypothetical protein ABZV46_08480, partial [Streptomyces sp. NPDC005209]
MEALALPLSVVRPSAPAAPEPAVVVLALLLSVAWASARVVPAVPVPAALRPAVSASAVVVLALLLSVAWASARVVPAVPVPAALRPAV